MRKIRPIKRPRLSQICKAMFFLCNFLKSVNVILALMSIKREATQSAEFQVIFEPLVITASKQLSKLNFISKYKKCSPFSITLSVKMLIKLKEMFITQLML